MTREQILSAYLEDKLLIEKGHLRDDEMADVKWTDNKNNKMIDVVKLAIEGVLNGDSQALLTRKVNQFLDKS